MSDNIEMIGRIRNNFLTITQERGDCFHHDDTEMVMKNNWWIERFILVTKTENAALKMLVKAMEWRKTFGVNELTEDYFPEEIYKIGIHHANFKDKEGRTILWATLKKYHKSDLSALIKKYLVFMIEKLDRQTSHQGWASINDSTGTALSDVDMDFNTFTGEVLQNYYPRGLKYLAVVDQPWILNATAKLLLPFTNQELRNCIKYLKSDELTHYVDSAYIPVHLKGSNDKEMVFIPEGVKPLEELTHTKFSAEQIKKIRSIYENELK